jgi:hypothetical protein
LSQTGAPTENPIAEAACLRQSLHVAVTSRDIASRRAKRHPGLMDYAHDFRVLSGARGGENSSVSL